MAENSTIRSEGKEAKEWKKFMENLDPQSMENIRVIMLKIDTEKVGKPVTLKYFEGGLAIGTVLGYLVLCDTKSAATFYSPKSHSGKIEELAYQTNCKSEGNGNNKLVRFYKTVSGS